MPGSSTAAPQYLVFLCLVLAPVSCQTWTWLTGSNTTNTIGFYGTANVSTGAETPGARRAACTAYDPTFKEFYVFGGFGQTNTTGGGGFMSDFWRFDVSTKRWAWLGGSFSIPGRPGTYPGARYEAMCTYDTQNHILYLYGGFGFADAAGSPGNADDVWRWTRATNTWSQLSGGAANVPPSPPTTPGGRVRGAVAFDEQKQILWIFGGMTASSRLSDLWAFFPGNSSWSWFGGGLDEAGQMTQIRTFTPGDKPGSRDGALLWVDQSNGKLYLFGGEGIGPSLGVGLQSSTWLWEPRGWTWVSGDEQESTGTPNGVTRGAFNISYWPSSRKYMTGGMDLTRRFLYVFGGNAYWNAGSALFNDLWVYNIDTYSWALIGGDEASPNNQGNFGTQGVPSAINQPPARQYAMSFVDGSDFYVFGGSLAVDTDHLQDLWTYQTGFAPLASPGTAGSTPTGGDEPPSLPPPPQAAPSSRMNPTAAVPPDVSVPPPASSGSPPPPTSSLPVVRPGCSGLPATVNSICINTQWIDVLSAVNVVISPSIGAEIPVVGVTQPVAVPGNFSILTSNASLFLTVPTNGSVPLQVSGCVSFNGNLIVTLPANQASGTLTLATFAGYCGGTQTTFKSFKVESDPTSCKVIRDPALSYNARSLSLALAVVDDQTCAPSSLAAIGGLSQAALIGIIVAAVVAVVIAIIITLVLLRHKFIPSYKTEHSLRKMNKGAA